MTATGGCHFKKKEEYTMLTGLMILGIIVLIVGILMIIAPQVIVKLNDIGNKIVFSDEKTIKHNRLSSCGGMSFYA